MSIRAHMLVVVTVVVTVVGLISVLTAGSVAFRALQQRENLEVRATLDRANAAVSVEVDQLRRSGRDWSTWDDSYRFMQDRNPAFARSNLATSALESLGVDFMGFLDASGRPVAVVSVDATAGGTPSLPPEVAAALEARPFIRRTGASGALAASARPIALAVEPIVRSDGSGPSAGTFVIGKYLDREDAQQFSRAAGADVSTLATVTADAAISSRPDWVDPQATPDDRVQPRSANVVAGYRKVQGIDGRTGLILAVTQPRTTMALAREAGYFLLIAAIVSTLALGIGLMVSLDLVVAHRITRLSEDVTTVSRGGDPSARVAADGDDEITVLAEDINSMLVALQESRRELEYMAGHDGLTNLFNRQRFEEELGRELAEKIRTGGRGALLWLDIDNFKQVNDSLGHAIGDRALMEFSKELKAETREYATLARVGGDEFAIILPSSDRREAEMVAKRIISILEARIFRVDEHSITLEASIGIALYPDHGTVTDGLLVCADIAMYDAKRNGGNRYCVYNGQRLSA